MQFQATGLLVLLVLGSFHNADAILKAILGAVGKGVAGALAATAAKKVIGDQNVMQKFRNLADQDANAYDEVMRHFGSIIAADAAADKAQEIMPVLDALAMSDDEWNELFRDSYQRK